MTVQALSRTTRGMECHTHTHTHTRGGGVEVLDPPPPNLWAIPAGGLGCFHVVVEMHWRFPGLVVPSSRMQFTPPLPPLRMHGLV